MIPESSVALVGMPGSGKSTVGRQLAKRLGWGFLDTDAVIEECVGCSVRQYFQVSGEASFRDVEASVLETVASKKHHIIATGGGTVLRPSNRNLLHHTFRVFYLRATPEDIFRRVRYDRSRPLLQVEDPLRKLKELFALRDPLYRETAHYVLETGKPSVATLVNMISMQLEMDGCLVSGS